MSTAPQTVSPELSALGFRLNFFKLVVRDIDAMADFYARAFGFEQRGERIRIPGLEEAMLALPGEQFTLVLYHWTDGREIDIGTGHGPVGFLTSDVDAAYAHALAHGATDMRAPLDLPGMRLAFVRDPEGHEIEMIQFKRPAAAKE
jgi:catechol 2,3-dioxygenase-like lactoylglutathione lyase family enzyme